MLVGAMLMQGDKPLGFFSQATYSKKPGIVHLQKESFSNHEGH